MLEALTRQREKSSKSRSEVIGLYPMEKSVASASFCSVVRVQTVNVGSGLARTVCLFVFWEQGIPLYHVCASSV